MKKTAITLLACLLCSLASFQSTRSQVPDWTHFLQVNTYGLPYVNAVTADNGYGYMALRFSGPGTFGGGSGTSVGLGDLMIVKISTAGVVQWVKLYNAGAGGTITPEAIKIDGNGNIFLAASFSGTVTIGVNTFSSDINLNSFMAKFNSSGEGLWATPFLSTTIAYATRIAADDNGNCYLTSKSTRLIKFSSAGTLLWMQDFPSRTLQAIAVSGSNLYLGGTLQSGTTHFGNIALTSLGGYNTGFLVKADLDGIYNNSLVVGGSTSGDGSSVSDITADNSGNLYITGGYTKDLILGTINIQNGTKSYYTYVALCDGNYNFAWASTSQSFSNPNREMWTYRLFRDDSGFLYESGMVGSNFQYGPVTVSAGTGNQFLVRFDQAGNALSAGSIDYGGYNRTIVSRSGNVLAGGAYDNEGAAGFGNFFLRQLDNNLNPEWSQVSSGGQGGNVTIRFIKYDKSGNTYLQSRVIGRCNYFGADMNTNRYVTVISGHDVAGNLLWMQQIEDVSAELFGPAFVLDKDFNILTVGLFNASITIGSTTLTSSNTGYEGYVAKFSKSGNFLWAAKMDLGENLPAPITVAADHSGNVIVSGINPENNYLIKFNAAGNRLWTKTFAMGSYYICLVSADSSNNIYMASELHPDGPVMIGTVQLTQTSEDGSIALIKFDPDGNALWAKLYGGVAGGTYSDGWPCDIRTDRDGNNYLWGWCANNARFGATTLSNPMQTSSPYNFYLAKFSSSGDVAWAKAVYESEYAFNYGDLLDLDNDGNLYAGGQFKARISIEGNEYFPESINDFFTFKYSAAGQFQWIKTLPCYNSSSIVINALSAFSDNILSIAGWSAGIPDIGGVPIDRLGGSSQIVATMVLIDPVPNAVNIGATGGSTADFTIFTGRSWTAVSDQAWLTISPGSGTGNAVITFTAAENPSTAQRTAIITITYEGAPPVVQTITVVQAGSGFGIADQTAGKYAAFPNPTGNILFLEPPVKNGRITISAADGRIITEEDFIGDRIYTDGLQPGLYTVRITCRDERFIVKFLKQ